MMTRFLISNRYSKKDKEKKKQNQKQLYPISSHSLFAWQRGWCREEEENSKLDAVLNYHLILMKSLGPV